MHLLSVAIGVASLRVGKVLLEEWPTSDEIGDANSSS
jgi:hypothetical protein